MEKANLFRDLSSEGIKEENVVVTNIIPMIDRRSGEPTRVEGVEVVILSNKKSFKIFSNRIGDRPTSFFHPANAKVTYREGDEFTNAIGLQFDPESIHAGKKYYETPKGM